MDRSEALKKSTSLKRQVDGVLLLDKPSGITSNAAIQRVKRLLLAAKAGHVGTLDPLASGMLPVCLGEATKFSTSTFGADKSYDAEILLGITTTTGDTEGSVTARMPVSVSRDQAEAVLGQFMGTIAQTPPMYSALKRDGKPLYAYARAGQTVVLEPRAVTIHDIALRGFDKDRMQISVRCSKGTYIRVLAEDIGRVLGCGATLSGLRRTTVGQFGIERAVGLGQLEATEEDRRLNYLLPVDALVSELRELELDDEYTRLVLVGQTTQLGAEITPQACGLLRLYDRRRHFLGLGEIISGQILKPRRLVSTSALNGKCGVRQPAASL